MIVCILGSTKFREQIAVANALETLKGNIVVTMGVFGHDDYPPGAKKITAGNAEDSPVKQRLNELSLKKIDMADQVLIVNPGNYIGHQTQNEIDYANATGKPIRYTEVGQI